MKILILGAGEVGAHLARVLSDRAELILMDRNADALGALEDGLDVLTVRGDITHRRALQSAGADKAAMVVAVTGSDDANLIGAALAAELGALRAVARVDDAGFYDSGQPAESGVLGVHSVLCAARLVGDQLFRLISAQYAGEVLAFARNAVHVATVDIKEAHPACGRPLESVEQAANIPLVIRDGRALSSVGVQRLEIGDRVIVCGERSEVFSTCRELVGGKPRRVMIVGGGDVGLQLAGMLSGVERRVQLIEKDPARAEVLAERLPRVNVICGDGSSIAMLKDEHIETVDYVMALTRSDEVNLMVSLVSRDLGVPSTYALVHRPGYEEIYRHLGVRGTTGPHDVLASAVQRLIPQSRRLTGVPLSGGEMECAEYTISPRLEKKLAATDLALPPAAHLLARVNLDGEIQSANAPLVAGQTLVLLMPPHAFREVESYLSRLGRKT